ncbi:MAG: shikimate dehydrogenase [Magnetovibrio sp.]|nr:shikimate dehydrogenase [Magnetovibrio sp.]
MANTEQTLRAGVIGWPVAHSLSPRLHGFWLDHYGIDGSYEPLAVAPDDFADALRGLAEAGFAGANVTVPHKEAAFLGVDRLSPGAERIGAVNTIVVEADGTLTGSNTDGFGFIENLEAGDPDWRAAAGPAAVLGAGGAARAVVAALLDAGVPEIRLVNRTLARAEALAADLGGPLAAYPWTAADAALEDATLLVNTTTLGMTGQAPLEIGLSALAPGATVNDIVYVPLQTDLLVRAQAQGCRTVDGIGMLLHQARPGFEAWFGVAPEVTPALRRHVLAGLGG